MNLDFAKKLPDCHGIYMMLNGQKAVIYVGKAKSLRKRVSSYFRKSTGQTLRIKRMISHVADIDFIVTDNEVEALILESNLIKKYSPPYNVVLRDDKHYPYIKITRGEPFPRIMVVRRVKKDNNIYLGPYPSSSALKDVLKFVYRTFKLRQCSRVMKGGEGRRPCLNYQMGICFAPCAGYVAPDEYNRVFDEVVLFLKGKNRQLIADLKRDMQDASKGYMFERAAIIRDQISSIERVLEKQSIVSMSVDDLDVVALERSDDLVVLNLLIVRRGEVVGNNPIIVKDMQEIPDREILYAFLTQHYSKEVLIPNEIALEFFPDEMEEVQLWLKGMSNRKVPIVIPKRGIKRQLLNRAKENARAALRLEIDASGVRVNALGNLKEILQLDRTPERIEAFDISTIVGGAAAVASMVVFIAGKKDSNKYKRFRLRTVEGVDDYGMMKEVLERRFKDANHLPDLLVIDGGVGQLHIAEEVVQKEFGFNIPIVSIAKGDDRNNPKTDILYTLGGEVVQFAANSAGRSLLQAVRNESHRFAINYHRNLREKGAVFSQLDNIAGIGQIRKKILLTCFGSVKGVGGATVEDIVKKTNFSRSVAENIFNFFNSIPPK